MYLNKYNYFINIDFHLINKLKKLTQVFGRRPNSYQAMICVLGFSANRVWLVSSFFHISIYFLFHFLHFHLINIQCRKDSLHNLPSGFNIHIFAASHFQVSLVIIPQSCGISASLAPCTYSGGISTSLAPCYF